MALDPERRAALDDARAGALVQRLFDVAPTITTRLPGGIGLIAGPAAFIHVLEAGPRSFGAAEIWSARQGVERVTFLVEPDADPGAIARRADALLAETAVFAIAGEQASAAVPSELARPGPLPAEMEDLAARVGELGLDVRVDHDEVVIECVGLEVGRLVLDAGLADLEAGVGSFDREANRVLHRGDTAWDVLVRVSDEVRRWRRRDALDHPLGRLAREAWLAEAVRAELGAEAATRLMPTIPRTGIRRETPVALEYIDGDERVVVLCTTGPDVALVGVAADHVARDTPDRLEVVVPTGSVHHAIHDLGGRLSAHCGIREFAPPWGS